MALHVSSAGFCVFNYRNTSRVRALASQGVAAPKKVEEEKVKLGGSDVEVTKLGIGAWSWGDITYWNDFQWDDRKLKGAKAAFDASIDCGITFFDTAEVYGAGVTGAINSETLIGRFIKERQQRDSVEVAIATKFAAFPWRFGRRSVLSALKRSLSRLGLSSVDLYQLHWPGIWGNKGYIDGLGDAVEQGLVKAVGVSNYSEKRLRDAYNQLKERGIPLASNQVNYSLIYRIPEENGVKAACDELGVTLIAYSPIAQGIIPNFDFVVFHFLFFCLLFAMYKSYGGWGRSTVLACQMVDLASRLCRLYFLLCLTFIYGLAGIYRNFGWAFFSWLTYFSCFWIYIGCFVESMLSLDLYTSLSDI